MGDCEPRDEVALAQFSSLSSFHLAEMQLADVAILSANESSLILAFAAVIVFAFCRYRSINYRTIGENLIPRYEMNRPTRGNFFSNIVR